MRIGVVDERTSAESCILQTLRNYSGNLLLLSSRLGSYALIWAKVIPAVAV
jgi:hypothetical protein